MTPNPALGVFLHALGGAAAGSFYAPLKKVKRWAWETYWQISGFSAWIITPWVVAMLVAEDPIGTLAEAPASALWWSYFFGVCWGFGAVTFGLTMRYLGMSLGMSVALGITAFVGTIVPPIYNSINHIYDEPHMGLILTTPSGLLVLLGLFICLLGIGICGYAGMLKERELTAEEKAVGVKEFSYAKGIVVALIAGVLSAFMAFAIQAGAPIAELSGAKGTGDLWVNTPAFIVIFAGGFTTNVFWCAYLSMKNRTYTDYTTGHGASIGLNYFLALLSGSIWYCQFMFYGMGTTQMGEFDFSSWTLHMAFIIVFSNLVGLTFKEWRGSSSRTYAVLFVGIATLIASTVIVGYGNDRASKVVQEEEVPAIALNVAE